MELDDILDSVAPHDLRPSKFGSFSNHAVEVAYRLYLWRHGRVSAIWAFVAWVALCAAVSFEFELKVYTSRPELVAVLGTMRILPLIIASVVLLQSNNQRWMVWWSPVAAVCLSLTVLAAQVLALLCSRTGDPGASSAQCGIFATAGIQPWVPILLTGLLPLYLVFGLQVRLLHASWCALLVAGGYIALTLAHTQGKDAIATSVLAIVATLLVAEASALAHDRLLRSVFRREVRTRRQLLGLMQGDLMPSLRAGQHKALAEVIGRASVAVLEVQPAGAITYASPAARRFFGVPDSEDVVNMDVSSSLHPEDQGKVAATWKALMDTGRTWRTASEQYRGYEHEILPFVRLHYRRKPAGHTTWVWVEGEAHLVLKRPKAIPGSSKEEPAGTPSMLLFERDVGPERAVAGRIVTKLQSTTRSAIAASVAAGAAKAGSADVLAFLPELPKACRITAGSLIDARTGAPSSVPEDALLIAAGAVPGIPPGPPPPPAAPMPQPGLAYDVCHQRSMATALIGMLPALSTVHALLERALPACHAVYLSLEAVSAGQGQRNGAAAQASLTLPPGLPPLATVVAEAQGLERKLQAVSSLILGSAVDVSEVAMLDLWKGQALSLLPTAAASMRAIVDTVMDRANAASGEKMVVSTGVDHGLPEALALDTRRVERALSMACAAMLEVTAAAGSGQTSTGMLGVRIGWSPVTANGAGNGTILVSFSCVPAPGLSASVLSTRLAADVGNVPGTPWPIPSEPAPTGIAGAKRALTRNTHEGWLSKMMSSIVLLPACRHEMLCCGGTAQVQSEPGGSGQGGEPVGAVTLLLTFPAPFQTKVPAPGPTLPDASFIRTALTSTPLTTLTVTAVGPPSLPASAGATAAGARPTLAIPTTAAAAAAAAIASPTSGRQSDRTEAGAVGASTQREKGAGEGAADGAGKASARQGDATARAAGAPGKKMPPTEAAGMRVLFVDDEPVNRRYGARMLANLGCEGMVAEDGDEVMGLVQAAAKEGKPFDAILLDIFMNRTDGAVVCKELRHAGVTDVAIIAMTGATSTKDKQRYQQAGFDLVLPKPFDLRNMLKALLAARELRKGPRERAELRRQERERQAERERAAAAAGAGALPGGEQQPGTARAEGAGGTSAAAGGGGGGSPPPPTQSQADKGSAAPATGTAPPASARREAPAPAPAQPVQPAAPVVAAPAGTAAVDQGGGPQQQAGAGTAAPT